MSFSNTDGGLLLAVVDDAVVVDATLTTVVVVVGIVDIVTSEVDMTSDVVGEAADELSPTGISEEQAVLATTNSISPAHR